LIYSQAIREAEAIPLVDNDGDGRFSEDGIGGGDEDHDCTNQTLRSQRDANLDGIDCGVREIPVEDGRIQRYADRLVDEDPNEQFLESESIHRGFVLTFGKIVLAFLIPLILALFLATGLVRDEIERETIHYIAGKPLDRSEILVGRLLGFLAVTAPYLAIMVILEGFIISLIAPGDGFIRIQDAPMWLAIAGAGMLLLTAYACLFCIFGIIHRFGMVGAIGISLWEAMMAAITIGGGSSAITRLSLVSWSNKIIDASVMLAWPDHPTFIAAIEDVQIPDGEISQAASESWGAPGFGEMGALASVGASIMVLLVFIPTVLLIGRSILTSKEFA